MHYKIHPLIALINTFNDSGDKKNMFVEMSKRYILKKNKYILS